ncbi:hypothetical protein VCSRO97_3337 [Vibrio cholerae]|nr:hypothetical protein VCSRO97_3337 [Vibrio cholerae]
MNNLNYPKLNLSVTVNKMENLISLKVNEDEIEIELDNPNSADEYYDLIKSFDGNNTVEDLEAKFGLHVIKNAIEELDEASLMKFGQNEFHAQNLIRQAEFDFFYKVNRKNSEKDALSKIFYSGNASEEIIRDFCIQYYHITYFAHNSIVGAISRATHQKQREQLEELYCEEYRHDRILLKALKGFGIDDKNISLYPPNLETSLLMAQLRKYSITDINKFLVAIMVFEGNKSVGENYLNQLEKYSLPESILEMHKSHEEINDEGEHFTFARDTIGNLIFDEQQSIELLNVVNVIASLKLNFMNAIVDKNEK